MHNSIIEKVSVKNRSNIVVQFNCSSVGSESGRDGQVCCCQWSPSSWTSEGGQIGQTGESRNIEGRRMGCQGWIDSNLLFVRFWSCRMWSCRWWTLLCSIRWGGGEGRGSVWTSSFQLCDYLYNLSTTFTEFYSECYVVEKLEGTSKVNMNRLLLAHVTANTMETALKIVGLKPVPKM